MDLNKKPKKLINHPDREIYKPERITWSGFLIAWGVVLLIVVLTMILARIGS